MGAITTGSVTVDRAVTGPPSAFASLHRVAHLGSSVHGTCVPSLSQRFGTPASSGGSRCSRTTRSPPASDQWHKGGPEMSVTSSPTNITRMIAAAIALFVLIDVLWVGAPFLIMLAVPFALTAWRYRDQHRATNIVVFLFSALFVALGIAFILSNGLHEQEPGEASKVITVGDFIFPYSGPPPPAGRAARPPRAAARRGGAETPA